MAFGIYDNIRETFTGAGSTTITLGGAAANSRAFSSKFTAGDTFWGVARAGAEISVGLFTYNTTTIAQTAVFYSSNSNNAVSFSSGNAGEVYNDIPANILDTLNLIEASLASASTTDLGSILSKCIQLTGTTGITSFGTSKNKERLVRYTGAGLTVTNSATLVGLGGADTPLATGDIFFAVSDNSATPIWRIMWVRRASEAYTSYNPTPVPTTGSYTTASVTSFYKQVGKMVHWYGNLSGDAGGSGRAKMTLPVAARNPSQGAGTAFNASTVAMVFCGIIDAVGALSVAVSGTNIIEFSFTYEAA